MSLDSAEYGLNGCTLILPNVTTTPPTGNLWWRIDCLADMEVTALAGPGLTGTIGTKTIKAGSSFTGLVSSITCSNTQTGGLMVGTLLRPI